VSEKSGLDETALALLRQQSFALILLDLHMPGMDGMTFLQLLRQQSPHPPVLIISGYVTFDSAAEAGRLGIAGVLKKPFSTADLLHKIKPILELRIESPVEYIRAYFAELHSKETLARHFGVTSRTLSNQIRQQTGQSFRDFLYSCRIQEAQHLLAETSLRVKEIYSKVGFRSLQVFARAFRRQTGRSPRQYRRETRRS
jgi:two-component system response regulator YesN